MTAGSPAAERVAKQVFGWPGLRPGQSAAIGALLAGRDALVVMPTGAGKSAVYQVAAVLLDGRLGARCRRVPRWPARCPPPRGA